MADIRPIERRKIVALDNQRVSIRFERIDGFNSVNNYAANGAIAYIGITTKADIRQRFYKCDPNVNCHAYVNGTVRYFEVKDLKVSEQLGIELVKRQGEIVHNKANSGAPNSPGIVYVILRDELAPGIIKNGQVYMKHESIYPLYCPYPRDAALMGAQAANNAVDPSLGGIKLSGSVNINPSQLAKTLNFQLESIDTLHISKSGQLVIIGQNRDSKQKQEKKINLAPQLNLQDLLLALIIVYSEQNPSFSLDPWDPQHPDGPFYQKVFYPPILAGTRFGATMFETDYLMKQYAFGVQVIQPGTNKVSPRKSKSKYYKHEGQLYFESKKSTTTTTRSSGTEHSRLWIVSENLQLNIDSENDFVSFGEISMVCKSMRQIIDPTSPSGLRDQETKDDQGSSAKFAKEFTGFYNEACKEESEFIRLRELAKLVGFCKWLKSRNIQINLSLIENMLKVNGVNTELKKVQQGPVPANTKNRVCSDRVPRLSFTHSRTIPNGMYLSTESLNLSGGVDLASNFKTTSKNVLPTLQRAISTILVSASKDQTSAYNIKKQDKGQTFQVVIVPFDKLCPEFKFQEAFRLVNEFEVAAPQVALDALLSILRQDPVNEKALYRMGQLCAKQNHNREAFFYLNKAGIKKPEDLKLTNSLVEKLQQQMLQQALKEVTMDDFKIRIPSTWKSIVMEEGKQVPDKSKQVPDKSISTAKSLCFIAPSSPLCPNLELDTLVLHRFLNPGLFVLFQIVKTIEDIQFLLLTENILLSSQTLKLLSNIQVQSFATQYVHGEKRGQVYLALRIAFHAHFQSKRVFWSQLWWIKSHGQEIVTLSLSTPSMNHEWLPALASRIFDSFLDSMKIWIASEQEKEDLYQLELFETSSKLETLSFKREEAELAQALALSMQEVKQAKPTLSSKLKEEEELQQALTLSMQVTEKSSQSPKKSPVSERGRQDNYVSITEEDELERVLALSLMDVKGPEEFHQGFYIDTTTGIIPLQKPESHIAPEKHTAKSTLLNDALELQRLELAKFKLK